MDRRNALKTAAALAMSPLAFQLPGAEFAVAAPTEETPLVATKYLPMNLHSLWKDMLGWRVIQDEEHKVKLIVFFKEDCECDQITQRPLQAGYFYRWEILGEAVFQSLRTLDEGQRSKIDNVERYAQMVALGPDGAWAEALISLSSYTIRYSSNYKKEI